MGGLGLHPNREEEIAAELTGHLEDIYEERRRAASPQEALDRALREVPDWTALGLEIRRAEGGQTVNPRTRSVWLPGLATLTLSLVLLFVRQGYTHFVWVMHFPPVVFYLAWLLALPAVGALGAYWSRRSGGGVRARLLAGLFPAVALASVFAAMLPVGFIGDAHVGLPGIFLLFATMLVSWALIPGVALSAGRVAL